MRGLSITTREREVLLLLAEDYTTKELAEAPLCKYRKLSIATVKTSGLNLASGLQLDWSGEVYSWAISIPNKLREACRL